MSVSSREQCDRWRWFAIYPCQDVAGDPSARLRQVARREGYRTVETEHGDGPTALMVRCNGPAAGVQIRQLMELAGVEGICVEVDF